MEESGGGTFAVVREADEVVGSGDLVFIAVLDTNQLDLEVQRLATRHQQRTLKLQAKTTIVKQILY